MFIKKRQMNPTTKQNAKTTSEPEEVQEEYMDYFLKYMTNKKKTFDKKLEKIAMLKLKDAKKLQKGQIEMIAKKNVWIEKIEYWNQVKAYYMDSIMKYKPELLDPSKGTSEEANLRVQIKELQEENAGLKSALSADKETMEKERGSWVEDLEQKQKALKECLALRTVRLGEWCRCSEECGAVCGDLNGRAADVKNVWSCAIRGVAVSKECCEAQKCCETEVKAAAEGEEAEPEKVAEAVSVSCEQMKVKGLLSLWADEAAWKALKGDLSVKEVCAQKKKVLAEREAKLLKKLEEQKKKDAVEKEKETKRKEAEALRKQEEASDEDGAFFSSGNDNTESEEEEAVTETKEVAKEEEDDDPFSIFTKKKESKWITTKTSKRPEPKHYRGHNKNYRGRPYKGRKPRRDNRDREDQEQEGGEDNKKPENGEEGQEGSNAEENAEGRTKQRRNNYQNRGYQRNRRGDRQNYRRNNRDRDYDRGYDRGYDRNRERNRDQGYEEDYDYEEGDRRAPYKKRYRDEGGEGHRGNNYRDRRDNRDNRDNRGNGGYRRNYRKKNNDERKTYQKKDQKKEQTVENPAPVKTQVEDVVTPAQ